MSLANWTNLITSQSITDFEFPVDLLALLVGHQNGVVENVDI